MRTRTVGSSILIITPNDLISATITIPSARRHLIRDSVFPQVTVYMPKIEFEDLGCLTEPVGEFRNQAMHTIHDQTTYAYRSREDFFALESAGWNNPLSGSRYETNRARTEYLAHKWSTNTLYPLGRVRCSNYVLVHAAALIEAAWRQTRRSLALPGLVPGLARLKCGIPSRGATLNT